MTSKPRHATSIVPASETAKAPAPLQPAHVQKVEFHNGCCRHPSSSPLSIPALVARSTLQEITVEDVSVHLVIESGLVKLPVLRASSGYSAREGISSRIFSVRSKSSERVVGATLRNTITDGTKADDTNLPPRHRITHGSSSMSITYSIVRV